MLEMLQSLLPLIGGGLFGAIVKLKSMQLDNERQKHDMMMAALTKKTELINNVNEVAIKNKGFSFARRTIAFAITSIIVIIAVLPLFFDTYSINVLQETKTGGVYLFGLIDTTKVTEEWIKLEGAVIIKEVGLSFQAIIGAYFGASIASNK